MGETLDIVSFWRMCHVNRVCVCVCVCVCVNSPIPSFPHKGAVACGLLHSVLLFLPALLPVLQQQLTGGMSSRRDGSTGHIRHSELETLDLTLAVLISILTVDYVLWCMHAV